MPQSDEGGSPDPLDCIGVDDEVQPNMKSNGSQSSQDHGSASVDQVSLSRRRPSSSSPSSTPTDAPPAIGSSPTRHEDGPQPKKPRLDTSTPPSPSSRAHLTVARQEPSYPLPLSSSDLPPDSPDPSEHASAAAKDRQLEAPGGSTSITSSEAAAILPPIASAETLSGESVSRADVVLEREILPTAHSLVDSLGAALETTVPIETEHEVEAVSAAVESRPDSTSNHVSADVVPSSPRPVSSLDASAVEKGLDHMEDKDAAAGRASSPVREGFRNEEDEGEDEIDPEDHHMDVDDPPAPGDVSGADTARPASQSNDPAPGPSPVSRATSPTKNRKKPSSKSKTDQGKPVSAASSTKTAPSSKKATKGKGKTKVDDLKASASAASPSSTPGSTKARSVSVAESVPASVSAASEAAGPNDGTELYCLCRKVFDEEDEEGVMVGCDGCEGWFHPSCIKIPEEQVPLLDLYICPNCEKTTSQRTTWQKICKRDGCDNSVTGRPSKYCSSTCAFQHMAGQIPPQANNKLLRQLSAAFVGLPRPVLGISTIHHSATVPSKPGGLDPQLEVVQQLAVVNSAIELVKKRQTLVEQVIAQCEGLAAVQVSSTATNKPAKKKGSQRSGADDRPCGWSARLLWDDQELSAWDGQPETETLQVTEEQDGGATSGEAARPALNICMNLRRRCDRHQGWQKTAPVSVEAELVQLERRKEMMEAQVERNKQSAENDATANEARETMKRHLAGRAVAAV